MLVHGSPGDGRSWVRVIPLLADRFHVMAVDLPGYGRSDPLPEHETNRTAAMGATVSVLIESFSEPVRLCGHSYGGNVALHAAIHRPATVKHLTLLEPVAFRALKLADDRHTLAAATQFFSSYTDRVTGGETDAVSDMIDFWFGRGSFSKLPSAVQAYLKASAAKNGVDVRASLSETTTCAELRTLTGPATVAYGDASPATAAAIARALARLLPNSETCTVAGAAHGMLDTHPAGPERIFTIPLRPGYDGRDGGGDVAVGRSERPAAARPARRASGGARGRRHRPEHAGVALRLDRVAARARRAGALHERAVCGQRGDVEHPAAAARGRRGAARVRGELGAASLRRRG